MFTKTNNNSTFKNCFMLSKDKFDAHVYSRFDMRLVKLNTKVNGTIEFLTSTSNKAEIV